MKKYKPGPGWRCLGGAVWGHIPSGIRIHWSCPLVRLANGEYCSMGTYDEGASKFIRISGNNKKRGIMAYARTLTKEQQ